jgi:maltooligosyltrehalose trehalohydrolase
VKIGVNYLGNGTCEFVVWAPFARKVELKLVLPQQMLVPLQKDEAGYWRTVLHDFSPGQFYFYI